MKDRAYIVVPFERVGTSIGPRQMIFIDGMAEARSLAQRIAPRVAGVAILERRLDDDTGESFDTLVADIGGVPPHFLQRTDWSVRLH